MKNNKIIFITFNITGKGTYLRALGLARELENFGHKIEIISTSPNKKFKHSSFFDGKIKITEMPDLFKGNYRSGWDLWATFYRCLWVINKDFDIVHCFENRPAVIFPGLMLKLRGAKLFSDWCDWLGKGGAVEERKSKILIFFLRPLETFFENNFRRFAIGTTVINKFLYKKAKNIGIKNLIIIGNGVDITRLHPSDQGEAKRKIGFLEGNYHLGHVGRIFPRDAKLLSSSFNQINSTRNNVFLVIIGDCNIDFSPYIKSKQHLIQTGKVDNQTLNYYMSAIDLFWVILNKSNANLGRSPLKILDIITVQKPYIYTCKNYEENFPSNNLGVYCTPNADEISKKSLNLLKKLPLIQKKISASYPILIKRLSWEEQAKKLEIFYDKTKTNR